MRFRGIPKHCRDARHTTRDEHADILSNQVPNFSVLEEIGDFSLMILVGVGVAVRVIVKENHSIVGDVQRPKFIDVSDIEALVILVHERLEWSKGLLIDQLHGTLPPIWRITNPLTGAHCSRIRWSGMVGIKVLGIPNLWSGIH